MSPSPTVGAITGPDLCDTASPMPSDRRHLLLVPLAALIAVLPLLLLGCSCGHDFDFHLISWFESALQFTHGVPHPHWASTPAWNAGEPRFVFYPPLSWTLGGLLGLLLPWAWTPIAYTWLALTAAGLSLHAAVRRLLPTDASPNAALLASCVYLANPYTLYTAYERTAYAELLAAAWLPLALSSVLADTISVPAVALPIALLWLTNAPAAVMGSYLVALVLLLRILLPSRAALHGDTSPHTTESRLHPLLPAALGLLLGLALAAFYILPALWEQRFVQIGMAILPGLSPRDNLLFAHTSDPDHDAVLRTASVLALVLIALTTATLALTAARRNRPHTAAHLPPSVHRLSAVLALLTALVAFMLTPLSLPLWNHLPELRFLQFPWRLLAVLAVVFALATALAARFARPARLPQRRAWLLALLATAALTLPSWLAFRQRCYPEDTLPARLALFRSGNPGTDPTDEYTPVTADNDALAPSNPAYWLASSANDAPPLRPPAPAPRSLTLALNTPRVLVLNLRDYPAWRVTVNDTVLPQRLHRADGLLALPLAAGHNTIRITWATLPDQQIGYAISSVALLLLTALLVLRRRSLPPLKAAEHRCETA